MQIGGKNTPNTAIREKGLKFGIVIEETTRNKTEYWAISFKSKCTVLQNKSTGWCRTCKTHDNVVIGSYLGHVYTGSYMFRSVWDQIHYGTDPLCLHGTGLNLERHGSIWDHLYKWTRYLVPDSRSDPYRIQQVPCKHKAYPYQFHTGSKRIRSRVNSALMYGYNFIVVFKIPLMNWDSLPAGSLDSKKCNHDCPENL